MLPKGKDSTLSDLTQGFVLDYRRTRKKATGGKKRIEKTGCSPSGATINRDLSALGAFIRWCREVGGLSVEKLKFPREKEHPGRERWLSSDELDRFRNNCPDDWWPFFATLFYTGARLGEVQGLRGGDVKLKEKRIDVHDEHRSLICKNAIRTLPMPDPLKHTLSRHYSVVKPGPADLIFPSSMQDYKRVARVWKQTCAKTKVADATPRDARHTFAVHAAQAGVPIVRLQKLLGHATATMTMRYMQHAKEAYLDEDSERIAMSMAGTEEKPDAGQQAPQESLPRLYRGSA